MELATKLCRPIKLQPKRPFAYEPRTEMYLEFVLPGLTPNRLYCFALMFCKKAVAVTHSAWSTATCAAKYFATRLFDSAENLRQKSKSRIPYGQRDTLPTMR